MSYNGECMKVVAQHLFHWHMATRHFWLDGSVQLQALLVTCLIRGTASRAAYQRRSVERTVSFTMSGRNFQAIDQNPQKPSRCLSQEIIFFLGSKGHVSSIATEAYPATDLRAITPSMPQTVSTSYPARMSDSSSRINVAGL